MGACSVREQLQHAIHQRKEFIERLQKLISKPPRWTVLPCVAQENPSRSIPADPARRRAALHRLADELYSKLQTMFIQAGAFNPNNQTVFKGEPITLPKEKLGFRYFTHVSVPIPFQLFARTCWNVITARYQVGKPRIDEKESWERVDIHTTYNKFSAHREGITCHSNIVNKLYEEQSRMVIAWISTTEDELLAREPTDIVDDSKSIWEFKVHPEDPRMTNITIVGECDASIYMEHEKAKHVPPSQIFAALEQL
ncbi:hypothetical protein LEN26_012736 [Aphanomyces euteiches]|nr:hypothetical protein LEN26_012736 [Aphanomyces euteiches]KAH9186364.1 hypothetical protein AeNC1_011663 [Aphanomyces euteiches]